MHAETFNKMAKPTEKYKFDWETFSVFRKDFIDKKSSQLKQGNTDSNPIGKRRHSLPILNKITNTRRSSMTEGCVMKYVRDGVTVSDDITHLETASNFRVEEVARQKVLNQSFFGLEKYPSFLESEQPDMSNESIDYDINSSNDFERVNAAQGIKVGDRMYMPTENSAFVVSKIHDESNSSGTEVDDGSFGDLFLKTEYCSKDLMFNPPINEMQSIKLAHSEDEDPLYKKSAFIESGRENEDDLSDIICEKSSRFKGNTKHLTKMIKKEPLTGFELKSNLCRTCTGCRNAQHNDLSENVIQNIHISSMLSLTSLQVPDIRKRSNTFPKESLSKNKLFDHQRCGEDLEFTRRRMHTVSGISSLFSSIKKRIFRNRSSSKHAPNAGQSYGKYVDQNITQSLSLNDMDGNDLPEAKAQQLSIYCSIKEDDVLQLFDFTKRSNEIQTCQWRKACEKDNITPEQYTGVAVSKDDHTDRGPLTTCLYNDPQSPRDSSKCGCFPSKPPNSESKMQLHQGSSTDGFLCNYRNNERRYGNSCAEIAEERPVQRRRAYTVGEFFSKTAQRVKDSLRIRLFRGLQDENKENEDAQPRRRAFTLFSCNRRLEARQTSSGLRRYRKKGESRENKGGSDTEIDLSTVSDIRLMHRMKHEGMVKTYQHGKIIARDCVLRGTVDKCKCSGISLGNEAYNRFHTSSSKKERFDLCMKCSEAESRDAVNDKFELKFPHRRHEISATGERGASNTYQSRTSNLNENVSKQKRSVQRKRSASFLVGPVSIVQRTSRSGMRTRSMSVPLTNSSKPKRPVLMYRYPGKSGNCSIYIARYRKYLRTRSKYSCQNKRRSMLDLLVSKSNKKSRPK